MQSRHERCHTFEYDSVEELEIPQPQDAQDVALLELDNVQSDPASEAQARPGESTQIKDQIPMPRVGLNVQGSALRQYGFPAYALSRYAVKRHDPFESDASGFRRRRSDLTASVVLSRNGSETWNFVILWRILRGSSNYHVFIREQRVSAPYDTVQISFQPSMKI